MKKILLLFFLASLLASCIDQDPSPVKKSLVEDYDSDGRDDTAPVH